MNTPTITPSKARIGSGVSEHNQSVEIVTLNKGMVDALLAINTKNRAVRKSVVDSYVREIQNGKWILTNQGIGISENGELIDGQHRLLAIKECGYPPIRVVVVRGLSEDSMIAVDQHSKRSARDLLQFAFDYKVSHSAPSIASVIFRETLGWKPKKAMLTEIYETIRIYKDELETVIAHPKKAKFFAAPYSAAFVMTMKAYPTKRESILSFMTSVETGELLTKDMPAFHLRNLVFTSSATKGGSDTQLMRFRKAIRALSAHIYGTPMGVLREFEGRFYGKGSFTGEEPPTE
jgi:hypothetical protein